MLEAERKAPRQVRAPRESRPCILLIDDDVVDKLAIRRSLQRHDPTLDIITAESGIEGFEYLRGANGRRRIKPPLVIVLDLNMPKMGGLEFLRELRGDPEHCSSVVFVCTTSADPDDIDAAYGHNIAGFFRKPDSADSYTKIGETLRRYLDTVELP